VGRDSAAGNQATACSAVQGRQRQSSAVQGRHRQSSAAKVTLQWQCVGANESEASAGGRNDTILLFKVGPVRSRCYRSLSLALERWATVSGREAILLFQSRPGTLSVLSYAHLCRCGHSQ
jgi:hypothetical protein